MCEYCGCQAIRSIEELTAEHEKVLNLGSEVRSAHASSNIDRMAEVARQIEAVLIPHTQVEEQGLFPAMTGEFPEQIHALEEEHRQIEAVLAAARQGTPSDPSWPERLLDIIQMLHEHIFKEQDGVFPAALASLSTEQWEAIEAIRSRQSPDRGCSCGGHCQSG